MRDRFDTNPGPSDRLFELSPDPNNDAGHTVFVHADFGDGSQGAGRSLGAGHVSDAHEALERATQRAQQQLDAATHQAAAGARESAGLSKFSRVSFRVATGLFAASLAGLFTTVTDTPWERAIKEFLSVDTTSTASGTMNISGIMPIPIETELSRTPKIVVADLEDGGHTGGDPKAQALGVVMDVVGMRPDQAVGSQVLHNPELAAILPEYEYAVVISASGGNLSNVAFNPVHRIVSPQRCWWENETNAAELQFEGCLDPNDPNYDGAMSSWSYNGGLHTDNGIAEQSEAILDVFANNNFCAMAGIYGGAFRNWDPVERTFTSNPFDTADSRSAGIGFMQTVISQLRIDAALSYGVDLAHVFTNDEYNFMLEHPEEIRAYLDGNGEAVAPFISESQVNAVVNSIDPPVVEVLAGVPIDDSSMDEIFDMDDPNQSQNTQNLVHCMPSTQENKDELTRQFDQAASLSQPAWTITEGLFPSGAVDPAAADAAVADLEAFIPEQNSVGVPE